ncbi:MAG: DUF5060 domain-containing protein [Candidatus Hydrogenedentota bacterium]
MIVLQLVLVFPLALSADEHKLESKEGVVYETLEWSIENPDHEGNPFGVEARAEFQHEESDRTIATPMFYDGQDTWKFRFTAAESGRWRVRTVGGDGDLAGWSGEVTVAENDDPGAHGFMRAIDGKWGWQGSGEVFIPQYVDGKDLDAFYDTDRDEVDEAKIDRNIEEFVDEHGFTGFHLEGRAHWFNVGGDPGEELNPDPRTYRVLETIIRKVHEKGGACHIWMWGKDGHGGPSDVTGEPMSEADQRNLRYLAARLGPLPGWSMGYGYDVENGWATREQLDAWKAYLEEHLGWDHFLGARVGYDEKGLYAVSPRPPRPPRDGAYRSPIADKYTTWLGGDYLGYTSYRPLYPRYKEVMQHHPDKPSFEEDRFRLRDRPEWGYKDYSPELTRRGLWHSAMAGGVANIWSNLLPSSAEGGSRPYDNRAEGSFGGTPYVVDIKHQIKTYSRFFENRFLPEMQSFYDGPELRLAAPEGEHALVYREDTGLVRLDLRRMDGSQPAVAVDTKQDYEEIEIGPLEPGEHTWEAPHRSDWAIAVGAYE